MSDKLNDVLPRTDTLIPHSKEQSFSVSFAGLLPPSEQSSFPTPTLKQVGRYIIDRQIGQGGLGVVYRAFDPDLKRIVALKMILANRHQHQSVVERFRLEAEAVARLNHPQIIQIYEVGTADSQPFIALEYVEGPTLARRLALAPVEPKQAAKLIEIVSRAIAHAHQTNIIHRDLKPSNILLERLNLDEAETVAAGQTRNDTVPVEQFRPKVADFGLAKNLDSTSDLTVDGDVVGTPSYMSPEQATGDSSRIGPTSDVWSLGAILYECLVGRPPFRGVNSFETIQLVQTLDPVSPMTLQPGLPRDLSVIAMKCLEKDQRRRYQTAQELADDLQRFQEGIPILARPVGPLLRGLKWARRSPKSAALLALVLFIPLLVSLGLFLHVSQLQIALDEKTRQEQRANQEKARADENYRQAREALGQMLDKVNDRRYTGLPRVMELRKVQADAALKYYRSVADQREDTDPEIRADAAEAEIQAGRLASILNQPQDAIKFFKSARKSMQSLVNEFPNNRRYLTSLANATLKLGGISKEGDSESLLDESLRLFRILYQHPEATLADRINLATAINTYGVFLSNSGKPAESINYFQESYDLRKGLEGQLSSMDSLRELAENAMNLSITFLNLKQLEKARKYNDEADDILLRLLKDDSSDRTATADLGKLRANWSYQLRHEGTSGLEKANKLLSEIKPMLERILALEPDDAIVRDALYRVCGARSEIYAHLSRFQECVKDQEQLVSLVSKEHKRFSRWFLAHTRFQANDHPGALTELEGILKEWPTGIPGPESYHGGVTCLKVANAEVLRGGVIGGLACPNYERTCENALRLFTLSKEQLSPQNWQAEAFQLRVMRESKCVLHREEFQQLLKAK